MSEQVSDSALPVACTGGTSFEVVVAAAPTTPIITVTAPGNQTATAGVGQSFNLGSFTASNTVFP